MDDLINHSVLRSAKRFFAGTLCSRISGFFRDVAMVVFFGGAPEVGAFLVAYRLANLFRRLLGEGSMQAGLVPHFTGANGKESAVSFYRDSLFSFGLVLIAITALLEIIFYSLSFYVTSGWKEIILLSMRMVPGLIFICLFAINAAFLQAHKRYFLTGFAPVMFNLCWIIFAFFSRNSSPLKAMGLISTGITFAFFCQWAITFNQVQNHSSFSLKQWFSPKLFSPEWKKVIRPVILGIGGVGAMQANSALDAIFSRFADLSGPVYLWNAIRIQQLPLSLFGIAISGALLPPLSRAIQEGRLDRYCGLLNQALRHSLAILVPCSFAILCLGGPGLNLLFGHGAFSSSDVMKTLQCLWGYAIGLVPAATVLILGNGFYAKKSYGIPTLISIGSVGFHILLNVLLVFGFGLGSFSIAISTSASALVNLVFLIYFLQKKFEETLFNGFWIFLSKLTFVSAISALITSLFGKLIFSDPSFTGGIFQRGISAQALQFCSMGALYLMSFVLLSFIFRLRDVFDFLMKRGSEKVKE